MSSYYNVSVEQFMNISHEIPSNEKKIISPLILQLLEKKFVFIDNNIYILQTKFFCLFVFTKYNFFSSIKDVK